MNVSEQLIAFNRIWKEWDDLYHGCAVALGLSDTAFWIILLLRVAGEQRLYTQRQLCDEWFYSPQTVNSALAGLRKQGLVELLPVPGSRKSKEIRLTSAGRDYAEKNIDPILRSELAAFGKLSQTERETLLALIKKGLDLARGEFQKLKR